MEYNNNKNDNTIEPLMSDPIIDQYDTCYGVEPPTRTQLMDKINELINKVNETEELKKEIDNLQHDVRLIKLANEALYINDVKWYFQYRYYAWKHLIIAFFRFPFIMLKKVIKKEFEFSDIQSYWKDAWFVAWY